MKFLISIIITLLTISVFIPGKAHTQEKARIAVFELNSDKSLEVHAKNIRRKIEFYLCKDKKYELINRSEIRRIMKEKGHTDGTYENTGYALSISKYFSADFIVLGTIDFNTAYSLNIRIIDIRRAKIFFSESDTYKNQDDFPLSVKKLTDKMIISINKNIEEISIY